MNLELTKKLREKQIFGEESEEEIIQHTDSPRKDSIDEEVADAI